jgi:hypothetical protein
MLQDIEGRLLAVLRVLVFEQGLKRSERVEYVDLRIARCLQSAWMGRKPRRQGGSAEAVPCDGNIFSDGKVAIHACLD